MLGEDEAQVLDVQDLGEVGDTGTGLQESNTGEEGPPYQPKGPGLALILLQVRINIAKIVINHLHYLMLKVWTLQNLVTPTTLYTKRIENVIHDVLELTRGIF
jgi:hypothetical protein